MSKQNARIGAQKPRISVEPQKPAWSDGQDATLLIKEHGFIPDPWQELILNQWLARDKKDAPLYLTCGLSCPRQNGKNGVIEAFELYKMVVCGEKILHTAHQVKTANKSFNRLASMFTDPANEELNELVVNIRRTNGEQAIYLSNGSLIEYSARSRGASRGNTYSVVVLDEAQELTDEQIEALMPTLAASPTGYRQMIYTGTPPSPNSPGTVFERIRKSSLTNPSKTTCWHEWSVEEMPAAGSTFKDVLDQVYETNPAMGIRLDEQFTENEFSTMSLDGFARERLGWWCEGSANIAIPRSMWTKAGIERDKIPTQGKRAFGVKFAPDGSAVALCGCLLTEEGKAHIEAVHNASLADGISWLSEFLCDETRAERTAAIAVDGKNGADALLDALREEYPRQALFVPGTKGVIASASMFFEALRSGKVTHWNSDKQEALNQSALTSIKRPIGSDGGWGFGGDNSPLIEAAALAYWAAKTTRRDPDGECEIY